MVRETPPSPRGAISLVGSSPRHVRHHLYTCIFAPKRYFFFLYFFLLFLYLKCLFFFYIVPGSLIVLLLNLFLFHFYLFLYFGFIFYFVFSPIFPLNIEHMLFFSNLVCVNNKKKNNKFVISLFYSFDPSAFALALAFCVCAWSCFLCFADHSTNEPIAMKLFPSNVL